MKSLIKVYITCSANQGERFDKDIITDTDGFNQ